MVAGAGYSYTPLVPAPPSAGPVSSSATGDDTTRLLSAARAVQGAGGQTRRGGDPALDVLLEDHENINVPVPAVR